jgi:putative peptidoglycan lipid II flippase
MHGLAQAMVLLILIGGAVAVYGLLLNLFGVTGWREAVSAIRHPVPRDLRG